MGKKKSKRPKQSPEKVFFKEQEQKCFSGKVPETIVSIKKLIQQNIIIKP